MNKRKGIQESAKNLCQILRGWGMGVKGTVVYQPIHKELNTYEHTEKEMNQRTESWVIQIHLPNVFFFFCGQSIFYLLFVRQAVCFFFLPRKYIGCYSRLALISFALSPSLDDAWLHHDHHKWYCVACCLVLPMKQHTAVLVWGVLCLSTNTNIWSYLLCLQDMVIIFSLLLTDSHALRSDPTRAGSFHFEDPFTAVTSQTQTLSLSLSLSLERSLSLSLKMENEFETVALRSKIPLQIWNGQVEIAC